MTIGSRHFVTPNPADDASSDPGDPLDLANWHPIQSKDPDGSVPALFRAAFQMTEGALAKKGEGVLDRFAVSDASTALMPHHRSPCIRCCLMEQGEPLFRADDVEDPLYSVETECDKMP